MLVSCIRERLQIGTLWMTRLTFFLFNVPKDTTIYDRTRQFPLSLRGWRRRKLTSPSSQIIYLLIHCPYSFILEQTTWLTRWQIIFDFRAPRPAERREDEPNQIKQLDDVLHSNSSTPMSSQRVACTPWLSTIFKLLSATGEYSVHGMVSLKRATLGLWAELLGESVKISDFTRLSSSFLPRLAGQPFTSTPSLLAGKHDMQSILPCFSKKVIVRQ